MAWRSPPLSMPKVDAQPFASHSVSNVDSSRNFWTVGLRMYGLPTPVRMVLPPNFKIWLQPSFQSDNPNGVFRIHEEQASAGPGLSG